MAEHEALVRQAKDVLSHLARRSQRTSGSWSSAERQHLAELSASLRENLELLTLHEGAAANAVTRARARAIVDLVADIGALCRGRAGHLAVDATARLPPPPPLDFGPRTGGPAPRGALLPASPATSSSSFAGRAQSLRQIATRSSWAADDAARLHALTASVCENASKLAQSRGSDDRGPPSAVARARGRAIDSTLSEIADLFAQRGAAADSGTAVETTHTVEWLRSQARRLVMGVDLEPAGGAEPDKPSITATAEEPDRAKKSQSATAVVTLVNPADERATRDEAAATANAVRRMSRRHKLAVVRAWRRCVSAQLEAEIVESSRSAPNVEAAEALRQENTALLQKLHTFEGNERDALARAQSAISNAESLAELNAALDSSLLEAQAEIKASTAATARALRSLAEAVERAEHAERQVVEMRQQMEAADATSSANATSCATAASISIADTEEVGARKVAELQAKLNDEKLAGAAKCAEFETAILGLQRQVEELQSNSADEAAAATRSAEMAAAKTRAAEEQTRAAEEQLLAVEQRVGQQSEESARKLARMQREAEQQQAAYHAAELSAQQAAAGWREQVEAGARELEQQRTETIEANEALDAERIERLAAQQSSMDDRAQLDLVARALQEAQEAAQQIAVAKDTVSVCASALHETMATNSDTISAAAERTAICSSAVNDIVGFRSQLQQHLQLEQLKVRALTSQQTELVADKKALFVQTRELELQVENAAVAAAEQHRNIEDQCERMAALESLASEFEQQSRAADERAQAAAAEAEDQSERMAALEGLASDLEQQSRAADERAQAAEVEADRMVQRIASLAEMKIQEAERQVQLARERARLKVDEAERLVASVQEEVEQLSAADFKLADRDLE